MMKTRLPMVILVSVAAAGLGYSLVAADLIPTQQGAFDANDPIPTKDPVRADASSVETKPGPFNTDFGLSDDERSAKYEAGWDSFVAKYTVWLDGLDMDRLDLHSLPRSELASSWAPPRASLKEALDEADLAVSGVVVEIKPTPFSGTDTKFEVEQTFKGETGSTITISQAGGLYPTPDWSGVVIGEGGSAAMLLPGDRAILLLQWDDTTSKYFIQSASGWYQLVDGSVTPNRYNTWGADFAGLPEEELGATLTTISR